MTKDDIAKRLRALAADDTKRSEMARLRDIFDEVEATLNAGVSQANVLAELHKAGFTMTLASFKSALYRIRQQRKKTGIQASPEPTALQEETATDGAKTVAEPKRLTKKQQRERLADQYIKPGTTNPLFRKRTKE